MPNEDVSCNTLFKDLRPECSKGSINTVRLVYRFEVEQCEIHELQQLGATPCTSIPCTSTLCLTSLYIVNLPGLPPPNGVQAIKNRGVGMAWEQG